MQDTDTALSHAPSKPFFRRDPITSILAIVVIFFLSQILAAILIGVYPLLQNWTDAETAAWLESSVGAQFFYVLLAEIFAVGMVYNLVHWARVTWRRLGWTKPKWRDFGYALILYGLYFVVYIVIVTIANALLPALNTEQEQQVGFDSATGVPALLLTFVSLVLLPPLAEEIMFRGFLFTSLRAKYTIAVSTIITSVLFGIAHLQFGSGAPLLWVAALDTFVLSCFLCVARERSSSLWPPIFLHAIKNSLAFIVLFGARIF